MSLPHKYKKVTYTTWYNGGMREKTMKRVNINLDQESLEILRWYKNQGKGYSFIIRLALALLRDTQDGTNS